MATKNNTKKVIKFAKKTVNHLPKFVTLDKIVNEITEHLDLVKWGFFRILIPIIIFHFLINLAFFQTIRLPVTLFSVVFYFYGAFFVDLDSFFNKKRNSIPATRLQKLAIICFAPIAIYYMLSSKIKPIHLPDKYFHRKKVFWIFALFSLVLGYLIFLTPIDSLAFALAGITGYLTHLATDRIIFSQRGILKIK